MFIYSYAEVVCRRQSLDSSFKKPMKILKSIWKQDQIDQEIFSNHAWLVVREVVKQNK